MTASENLDLVRSIYRAWERGDFSSAAWAHPEIEYVQVGGLAPGSWTGLAGMAEAMRGVLNAWEDFRVAAVECRELDDERFLVFTRASGRGKASGLELGQIRARDRADVLRIRDGKVTKLVTYADRDHALADLGLTSQGEAPSTNPKTAQDIYGESWIDRS
jgi:ketosteroid isomerase-like protein